MAKRTFVQLIDDLDGGEAVETVAFSLDGNAYEIDLSDAHAAGLRDALGPFVSAARKARSRNIGPPRTKPSIDPEQRRAIRDWANSKGGYKIGDRGRIPADVIEAFQEAHA